MIFVCRCMFLLIRCMCWVVVVVCLKRIFCMFRLIRFWVCCWIILLRLIGFCVWCGDEKKGWNVVVLVLNLWWS